jgi:plastocyanin
VRLQVGLRAAIVVATLCCVRAVAAQEPVTIHVDVSSAGNSDGAGKSTDSSNVAVWLAPLDAEVMARVAPVGESDAPVATILQKDKVFIPHVTVVRTGSAINFPNDDPFFHNVFSLYNGKRFDLGLYESGTSKALHFNRPGVSYLFCNIHENMSAVVLAVDTPFFGVTDRAGHISIANVPDGRYAMHVFYERSTAEALKALDRTVTIVSGARTIQGVHVAPSPDVRLAHKNKYGEDYVPPPAGGYAP